MHIYHYFGQMKVCNLATSIHITTQIVYVEEEEDATKNDLLPLHMVSPTFFEKC